MALIHPLQNVFQYRGDGWHMQAAERVALIYVVQQLKPELSIEIGTLNGGSLRPIAAASGRVYALDTASPKGDPISGNVEFLIGDSAQTLPPLIDRHSRQNEEIGFILVDGSHEEAAVRADLQNCLRYKPRSKATVILMHDSSNPTVRKVIGEAGWSDNPHVHALDLDFVPGMLYGRADIKNQIWGGFAAALLLPEKRTGEVDLRAEFSYSVAAFSAFA
jgi:Methyltransferase domain